MSEEARATVSQLNDRQRYRMERGGPFGAGRSGLLAFCFFDVILMLSCGMIIHIHMLAQAWFLLLRCSAFL